MSNSTKTVDHIGMVQEVTNSDVVVRILSQSACAGCHASGTCGMADSTEKLVVVHKPNHSYIVNQSVKVTLKQSLGFKALLIGYVMPFLLVLFTLLILTSLGLPEARAGLSSLSILVPYYAGLYLLKDRISKQFTFDIESI